MNPALKAAFTGAGIGFAVMLLLLVLQVRSPLLLMALWPTRVLNSATRGSGEIWQLIFQTTAFFGNAVLYGIAGYLVGKLLLKRGTTHE